MMGVGKTTSVDGWPRRSTARSPTATPRSRPAPVAPSREIFEADGEAAFRALESAVLAEPSRSAEPTVVAAAGGVVLDAGNRRLLRGAGTVVWLRAPVVVLVDRVATGHHRPAVEDDPEAALTRMEYARADLYAEVADVIIDSTLPLAEVVAEVLAVVERREAAA